MSTIPPTEHSGLWKLLLLDTTDQHDPKWIMCTVSGPDAVRPARAGDNGPDDVTARWAGGTLVPLTVTGWRVDA
jgi:hypothetical protein